MDNMERLENQLYGQFWTRQNELVEDLEELGYDVWQSCGEYITISDPNRAEDDETGFILYLGRTNSTIWISNIHVC